MAWHTPHCAQSRTCRRTERTTAAFGVIDYWEKACCAVVRDQRQSPKTLPRLSLEPTETDVPGDGMPITDIPTRAQDVAAMHLANVNPHSQVRRCCRGATGNRTRR